MVPTAHAVGYILAPLRGWKAFDKTCRLVSPDAGRGKEGFISFDGPLALFELALPGDSRRATMPAMDSPLFAPWRMDYIRSLEKGGTASSTAPPDDGCFICAAAKATSDDDRRGRYVLWRTELTVVLMNLFPYNNGHLLIAPATHKADMEELTHAELTDVQVQTTECVRLLKRAVSAQGFNIGINLGKCAGAGLPGHLHQHVVPRWAGDTNFMGVVGEVRVIPQAISQLYGELLRVREVMTASSQ